MHSYLQLFHPLRGRSAWLKRAGADLMLYPIFSILALALLASPALVAQQHLVSPAELQQQIRNSTGARDTDLSDVREFFSSEPVSERLPAAIDAGRIEELLPFLDDAELARLAETARCVDRDLKAGALSNEHLTYIVIALATAVIVILLT